MDSLSHDATIKFCANGIILKVIQPKLCMPQRIGQTQTLHFRRRKQRPVSTARKTAGKDPDILTIIDDSGFCRQQIIKGS
jgi:hypothetical protein